MKRDWIGLIAILLMVVGASFLSYHFIVNSIHTCTANPLGYFISQQEFNYNSSNNNYSKVVISVYQQENDYAPIYHKEFFRNKN